MRFNLLIPIALATTVSGQYLGNECVANQDCKSQHCVPLCSPSQPTKSYCIEADWFFIRHGMNMPDCVNLPSERHAEYAIGRLLHETCHNDKNCVTKHCVPECSSKLWRCVEPRDFFATNNLEMPKCVNSDVARNVKQRPPQVANKVKNNLRKEVQISKMIPPTKEESKAIESLKAARNAEAPPARKAVAPKMIPPTEEKSKAIESIKAARDAEAPKEITPEIANARKAEDESLEDLEAKKLEEDALEKLRQIDLKVMQLQEEAMKKRRNNASGQKKKIGLFSLWSNSVKSYFHAAIHI